MADDCGLTCASRREFLAQMSGVALAAMVGADAAFAEPFYSVTAMSAIEIGPSEATRRTENTLAGAQPETWIAWRSNATARTWSLTSRNWSSPTPSQRSGPRPR